MSLTLTRKREKEIKKLRKQAEKLWSVQRDVGERRRRRCLRGHDDFCPLGRVPAAVEPGARGAAHEDRGLPPQGAQVGHVEVARGPLTPRTLFSSRQRVLTILSCVSFLQSSSDYSTGRA